ncbi:glycyl radical protein, partial [Escherichia coli]|nr:glycyl radical protein [Escherichia coli]
VFTVGNYFFGGVGHVSVDYGKVLKIGFRGIIDEVTRALEKLDRSTPDYIKKEQFYNAVILSYQAAINFAHRYAQEASRLAREERDPTRQRELEQIASNCTRVPEYGATTFWEACQTFWFIQSMLQIESSGHSISPGRFDQYMYPYLAADTAISSEFAQELVDCCWIK